MGIKHAKVSAVSDGGDTSITRPSDWNAEHTITEGVVIPVNTNPTPPAADNILIFGHSSGGRIVPMFVGPSGVESSIHPNLARDKTYLVLPNGQGTVITYIGATALTAVGTATAKNWASTNLNTSMRGVDYLVTPANASAIAGFRGAAQQWQIGSSSDAKIGGFHFICRWAPATGSDDPAQRLFCGMRSLIGAPTDVNPSSYVNLMGMGLDSGDANLSFMTNDSTGTATKTSLGASFPRPTVNYTYVYELDMFIPPNGTTLKWVVSELSTGVEASGSVTTDLPVNNLGLAPLCYHSAGGTSSLMGVTLYSLYIGTDF